MSDEYWIISVPGKSTPRQSYDEVCQATGRDQLSQNYLFNIPDLKVWQRKLFHRILCSIHLGWYTRFTCCTFGWLSSTWWIYRRVKSSLKHWFEQNWIFRVTKKLTQFFFNDVLDGDRNRLAENLVVGANGGMYKYYSS